MARFRLTDAFVPPTQPYQRLPAGRVISDGVSPAAGDFIWTGLVAATYLPCMTPLDGGATTIKNASSFASIAAQTWTTGAGSVDG